LQLTFLVPREDDRTINLKSAQIIQRNDLKKRKFETIVQFLKNNTDCRNQQLLHYFGEENPIKCGICDVCLNENSPKIEITTKDIEQQLIKILAVTPKSIHELMDIFSINQKKMADILHLMIEKDLISLNLQHKFQLK
jgi:ATP-dependent DNA helicase RecQ